MRPKSEVLPLLPFSKEPLLPPIPPPLPDANPPPATPHEPGRLVAQRRRFAAASPTAEGAPPKP